MKYHEFCGVLEPLSQILLRRPKLLRSTPGFRCVVEHNVMLSWFWSFARVNALVEQIHFIWEQNMA